MARSLLWQSTTLIEKAEAFGNAATNDKHMRDSIFKEYENVDAKVQQASQTMEPHQRNMNQQQKATVSHGPLAYLSYIRANSSLCICFSVWSKSVFPHCKLKYQKKRKKKKKKEWLLKHLIFCISIDVLSAPITIGKCVHHTLFSHPSSSCF